MDTLQKYKNHTLYEVPEHYFEQFQQDVMQRVKQEKQQQKVQQKWISAVSVAASFAIIVTLSFFIFVNKNSNEHFYVHEEITQSEDTVSTFESNQLAEASELAAEIPNEPVETPKPLSSKAPFVAETIAYRAVDFYLDDYTVDSFCEVMYDLECFFDY